ncbi:MAG: hypothetical protein M3040_10670 [Bacteroidota bacterium]|nr:hypothetical protein [Bacteroidota bacterium]
MRQVPPLVEHTAKQSKIAEHTVAGIAIGLMMEYDGTDKDNCTSHVGYYLIPGVKKTKKLANMPVCVHQSKTTFYSHIVKSLQMR